MREIKFRAWDDNQFRYLSLLPDKLMLPPIEVAAEYVWQQFTGLLDKNGKEIYEGDILKTPTENVTVEWIDHLARWGVRAHRFNTVERLDEIEVIGNIYENPELLEKS